MNTSHYDDLRSRLGEVELWIDRLSYVADSDHVRDLLRGRRNEIRAAIAKASS